MLGRKPAVRLANVTSGDTEISFVQYLSMSLFNHLIPYLTVSIIITLIYNNRTQMYLNFN